MNNQSGKGSKVANDFRTPQWENSKLWQTKAKNQGIFKHAGIDLGHGEDVTVRYNINKDGSIEILREYKFTELMLSDGDNEMSIYDGKNVEFATDEEAREHCDKLNKESAHCVRWEYKATKTAEGKGE